LSFEASDFLAQGAALFDQLAALVGVLLFARLFLERILAMLDRLGFLDEPAALVVETNDPIQVSRHIAVAAIGSNCFQVLPDEGSV
jgi:hypothetical protein